MEFGRNSLKIFSYTKLYWYIQGSKRLTQSILHSRQFSSRACCWYRPVICQQQWPANLINTSSGIPHAHHFFLGEASSLHTMTFNPPEFKELFTPELKKLVSIFEKHNFELRIAGGAVRDLLLGKIPDDIDFATTATPTEMKTIFEEEEVRVIKTRGEAHGTITCRIDHENFEVTTLRVDVVTDGRHAEVEFTRDWEKDALRRDLTFNSMFLGLDGILYDYCNGASDLENKRVCFVGSATTRIQEDYLRILRYFRFYGRIASDPAGHEAETLEAIRENMHGLERISGERIWVELKKIIQGNYAWSLIKVMLDLGMASYVGLPDNPNIEEFLKIYGRSKDLNPLPLTLLPALLNSEEQMHQLNKRLKMSRDEYRLGLFIVNHRGSDFGPDLLHYCQDVLCDVTGKEGKPKEKLIELLKYLDRRDVIPEFEAWQLPNFPVSGIKLLERGVEKGPKLAATLKALRHKWKQSRYTYTEDDLLQLADVLDVDEQDS